MGTSKPEVDIHDLIELEAEFKKASQLTPGRQKDALMQVLKEVHADILNLTDVPTPAIAPDAHLLGIADWGSGMMRSAGFESALLAKAAKDKLLSGKTDYNAGEAADRLTDAIVPMGDPARGSGEYLDRLGAGEMGHLANTEIGQKMGIEPGSRWDITGRGALGFGLDTVIAPGNVKSMLNYAENKSLANAAKRMGPKTAAQYAEELAAGQKAASIAPSKNLFPSLSSVTDKGKTSLSFDPGSLMPGAWTALQRGVTDPLGELGNLLYKSRFRQADAAAEQAGKKLPSQIMAEHGRPGITSGGIREGMRGIIDRTENSIDEMATPAELKFAKPRAQALFATPILALDKSRRAQLPGSSQAIDVAVNDGLKQFEHAARQEPAIMQAWQEAQDRAGTAMTAPDGSLLYENGARQEVLPGISKVTNNSGFEAQTVDREFPRLKRVMVEPAVPPRRVMKARPDGSPYYEDIPGKPAVYKDVPHIETVPMTEQVHVDRPATVEPGRDTVVTEGRIAEHGPAPKSPLEMDRQYDWRDARQMRRSWQKQAADADLYTQRDPLNPGPQAAMDETARLHNALGNRAGELELQMLDEAKPGLGGEHWNKHRDVSGLLTGAPYLDREFTGGGVPRAVTGFRKAINPLTAKASDLLEGAVGVAQAGGGKALLSPWTRKALAPAARAMWLNDYWNREYTESENNPYAMIKKYGVQR